MPELFLNEPAGQAELLDNANADLARSITYPAVLQVCWKGGLPPCPTVGPFQWEPPHEFRGLRHLLAWRRWGWPSERVLAAGAIGRVLGEPYIMQGKSNSQRAYGWCLLLLTEALSTPLGQAKEVVDGITKLLDILTTKAAAAPCGVLPNTDAGADHDFLPFCSWQVAILAKALGRLVRRHWPDPRAAILYKACVKLLDWMREPGTWSWVKDGDPATGATMPAESLYEGTSLWTACTTAESFDLVTANSADRRTYIAQFVAHSAALKPTDKNYDAGAHALIAARLAA
jgi:hypothetical protein